MSRRDRLRLASMVVLFVFILAAMRFTAKPSSWYWLTGQPDSELNESSDVVPDGSKSAVLFGEASSAANGRTHSADQPTFDAKATSQKRQADGEQDVGADKRTEGAGARTDSETPIGLSTDLELLQHIRDDTIGVRQAEIPARNCFLAKARDCQPGDLKKAAIPHLDFSALLQHPDLYRGRILTIEGDLRRLSRFQAGANDYDLTELYEAWVFTRRSGANPYRVVCSSVPVGIPLSLSIDPPEHVQVSGFFFKRYSYATADGQLHSAPLILAKSLRWYPARPSAAASWSWRPYAAAATSAIVLAIGFIVWRTRVRARACRQRHVQRLTQAPADAFATLNDLPVADVRDTLFGLSASDDAAD